MDKIYQRSKDVYVSATLIYPYSGGAYTDKEHATQYTTSQLVDAFEQGALVQVDENVYATPVGCSIASDIATITYIVANGTTATSADIASLVSVADPE